MGLTRKIRRDAARRNGIDWPTRQQPFRMHSDLKNSGYDTLHFTKGWRRVSGKRLGRAA